jgi:hypothetical protein
MQGDEVEKVVEVEKAVEVDNSNLKIQIKREINQIFT